MDKVRFSIKIRFAAVIILLLSLFSLLLVSFSANALINTDDFYRSGTSPEYFYFENPELLACDGGNIYVYDNRANAPVIYKFSENDYSLTDTINTTTGISYIFVNDNIIYTVKNDGIYKAGSLIINGAYSEIFVDGSYIYALSQNKVEAFNKNNYALVSEYFTGGLFSAKDIKSFAVLGDTVYAVTKNHGAFKNEIYSQKIDGLSLRLCGEDLEPIEKIAAIEGTDKIAVFYRSRIALVSKGLNELIENSSTQNSDYTALCAGSNIYTVTSNKSVVKFDSSSLESKTVLASSGKEQGFYRNPSDVCARFGKMYVADKSNNRLSVFDGSNYTYVTAPLYRPVAVSIDSFGIVYVSHSENKIAQIESAGNINTVIADSTVNIGNAGIKDINIDSKNNLYLLSDENKLYVKKAGSELFEIVAGGENILAFDVSFNSQKIYALLSSGIETLQDGNFTHIISGSFIDFSVDADGRIYALKENNSLEKYELNSGAYTLDTQHSGTLGTAEKAVKISASFSSDIKNSGGTVLLNNRDLILIDAARHTVSNINYAALGVADIDLTEKENAEDIDNRIFADDADEQEFDRLKIIRRITKKGGADVYAQSSEASAVINTLPENFKVIVTDFDASSAFTRIYADTVNAAGSVSAELTIGYVNTEFLSDVLPYTTHHEETCNVWLHDIAVYSLPSRQSPKLAGYENVGKNTVFKLLNFAFETVDGFQSYGYRDNFPDTANTKNSNRWYRILVENNDGKKIEGFVFANEVSILGGNPDLNIRPQTNAIIIAKDKNEPQLGAFVYFLNEESGEYERDIRYDMIAVNTKVEVVGTFDSSEAYTKILFYTQYGTVEAYVETANLKFQGVNFVQIVAVIIIIIAIILITILLVRTYKIKTRQIGGKTRKTHV